MCGIVAFVDGGRTVSLPMARRALDALRHRGPDAAGEWQDDGVFLGHRRLSIIDLKTGQQPMHSSDGRYVITFNGEIYNFRELRQQLERAGACFRTQSDTEVILEGYRHWGSHIVERLNGMFAFVIWDRSTRSAFVARDRLGIKPLSWALIGGALIVSSTLEPFAELGAFDALDPVAIRDLMTFDYIPAPRSIRTGVHKLEPGCRFTWTAGSGDPAIESYWRPPALDHSRQAPDEEELEELLDRSVRRQMVSDVPLGVFLSGGIDSSLIVALMARHSGQPVKTYSVSFSESDADESAIAAKVAQRFGTEHSVLRAEEIGAEALQQLIGSLDEPFCDAALVPLYALSRLTREHVKVALSGDGGDEIFGGYQKYLRADVASGHAGLSSFVRRSLEAVPWRPRGVGHLYQRTLTAAESLRYSYSRYGDFPVFRKDLTQLFSRDFRETARVEEFFEPWDRIGAAYGVQPDADMLMRTDLRTYLSENCLVKTDRASMLASLEVRVPFLDELLLDRIVSLHASRKIVNGQLKALLLPLAKRLLPADVWNRPKHGFNVPVEVKLAGIWQPVVDDALAWGERHLPVFNYRYLRRLQRINLTEQAVGLELWNPVVLLTWAMAQAATGSPA
jgi:asparagine synthase (glutamine-hydrolysing)